MWQSALLIPTGPQSTGAAMAVPAEATITAAHLTPSLLPGAHPASVAFRFMHLSLWPEEFIRQGSMCMHPWAAEVTWKSLKNTPAIPTGAFINGKMYLYSTASQTVVKTAPRSRN